jgi:hypothetical protein
MADAPAPAPAPRPAAEVKRERAPADVPVDPRNEGYIAAMNDILKYISLVYDPKDRKIKFVGSENLDARLQLEFPEILAIFSPDRYDLETLREIATSIPNMANEGLKPDALTRLQSSDNNILIAAGDLLKNIKGDSAQVVGYRDNIISLVKQLFHLQIKILILKCNKLQKTSDDLFNKLAEALKNKLVALNDLLDYKLETYDYMPPAEQEGGSQTTKYYQDKYKYMKYKLKYLHLKNNMMQ